MQKVLVVLPVHNEEIVLEQNVQKLFAFLETQSLSWTWQVCIAVNGSTDHSFAIAQELTQKDHRFFSLDIPTAGRGNALSQIFDAWCDRVDVLAYMDIDLSVELTALPPLINAVVHGNTLAYGSRFEQGAAITRGWLRECTSRVYRFLVRWILGLRATDAQCGFKAIASDAWKKVRPHVQHAGWFWDTELLLTAEHLDLSTIAIPVVWVETRDARRKSSVKLLRTIAQYLFDITRLRYRLWRDGNRA